MIASFKYDNSLSRIHKTLALRPCAFVSSAEDIRKGSKFIHLYGLKYTKEYAGEISRI